MESINHVTCVIPYPCDLEDLFIGNWCNKIEQSNVKVVDCAGCRTTVSTLKTVSFGLGEIFTVQTPDHI